MKHYVFLILAVLSCCFMSCSDDAPMLPTCNSINCEYPNLGNVCVDGKCPCETENFSFFQWKWRCQTCGNNQFIPARLEVDGSIIGNYTVGQPQDETQVIKIPNSGQVSFKVISTASNNVVEEGNISLIKCELVTVNSIY